MQIIACVNRKGGSGKTTIAWNVANYLTKTGKSVLVVDADPQGTLIQFYARRENKTGMSGEVVPLSVFEATAKKWRQRSDHEFVIVDTPGTIRELAGVFRSADKLICPIQPTGAEYLAFRETVQAIRETKSADKIIAVGNRIKTEAQRKELREAVSVITAGGGRLSAAEFGDWVKMQQETMSGLSAVDIAKATSNEYKAISLLAKEVEQ